jgi:hypothetical protein
MTTGASAAPRAGCPSRPPEDPEPLPSCSEGPVFSGACRSADDDEDPPLPAPQPIEKVAANAARMRSATAPRTNLRKSVLVPITSLSPGLIQCRQL